MDMILQGVEKFVCKHDAILIGGVSWQENIKILAEVLKRLRISEGGSCLSGFEDRCRRFAYHRISVS